MLDWAVPENTKYALIAIIGLSLIITYLVHRQSIEYLLSRTKPIIRRILLRLSIISHAKKYPHLPKSRHGHPNSVQGEYQEGHSQFTEQHPDQETTRITHEINQE